MTRILVPVIDGAYGWIVCIAVSINEDTELVYLFLKWITNFFTENGYF
jgi:hypothetical protein